MKIFEKSRQEAISKLISKHRDDFEEFLQEAYRTHCSASSAPPLQCTKLSNSCDDGEIAYLRPYGELTGIVRIVERMDDLVLVELLCDAWVGRWRWNEGDEIVVKEGWLS